MGYTLKLQNRKRDNDVLVIPLSELQYESMLENENQTKDDLFEAVKNAGLTSLIHDKEWLKQIINWTPPDGLEITEMAKWVRLAERVNELDNKECEFSLTNRQAKLIYNRIKHKEFKLRQMSLPFLQFLMHFQEETGYKIVEEED